MGKDTVKQWCAQHLSGVRFTFTIIYSNLFYLLITVFLTVANAQTSLKVRSIGFEGNRIFSVNQLISVSSIKKGDIFSEPILKIGIENVLNLYKSQAYLHAYIDSLWIKKDTLQKDVELRLFLNEGKPSIVRQIELDSCRNIDVSEIYATMKLHEGDLFVPSILEQDVQSILQLYESKGYPLAKVMIKNVSFTDSIKEMSVRMKIYIDEGKELHVTELRIEGNKTTKDYVITREARLHKNELFQAGSSRKN